jgi:hypothetical protein
LAYQGALLGGLGKTLPLGDVDLILDRAFLDDDANGAGEPVDPCITTANSAWALMVPSPRGEQRGYWNSVGGPMGLFARRQEQDAVAATATSGGPPGSDAALPARFQVVSVAPGRSDDEASITGVVLSELPARVGQLVVHLSRPHWPDAAQELPAVVDPAAPGRFAVTWAVVAVVGGLERTIAATQWNDPDRAWDPGPDGVHERALARWLTEHAPVSGDLAGGL